VANTVTLKVPDRWRPEMTGPIQHEAGGRPVALNVVGVLVALWNSEGLPNVATGMRGW